MPKSANNSDNSRRIAKNTSFLYIRMLFTLGVSLYTSRVVLNALGVVDFGIYNVVAGVVVMFSFLNTSMSAATQRYLSFELGKKDFIQLKKIFSMSVNIHIGIGIIILILAETVGLYFLNTALEIPSTRMTTANWVYQFTVLTFIASVLSVPYNAVIIAHENMKVFAYVSFFEVVLKLIAVLLLVLIDYDKLQTYAILTFSVSLIISLIYWVYSKRSYSETSYNFSWDKKLFSTMLNYAGWNLFGNIAGVAMGQGLNIILNLFFGPIVNAARGIAFQLNGAINGFVSNFQMALNPQIVKSYASEDLKYMHQLIYQGAKFSFFLLLMISLPLFLEAELVLLWWLTVVPKYSVIFLRLVLLNTLIDCISGPLMTAALASGKIKNYQAVVGGLLLLILPISYTLLEYGFPPESVFLVGISVSVIALFLRLFMLRPLIKLSIGEFLMKVVLINLLVFLCAISLPLLLRIKLDSGILRFFIVGIGSILCTIASIILLGLEKNEKNYLLTMGKSQYQKIFKN